ncbi:MAG TPA: VWA domain-containing protein [Vicinamibacterales bacterium]|nr:VWA domain-containing protein [Vicinamibacterales bacterium]
MPRTLAVGAAVGVLLTSVFPAAQTFRTSTNVVEVQIVVTDRSGKPVPGLTRDDFEIVEDGKPQSISLFSFIDIPLPMAPVTTPAPAIAPAVTADVVSNALKPESRLYLIVLDGNHVDASRSTTARRMAREFITTYMGPDDIAAVVQIGGSGNQNFTSNKQLLLAALDDFIGGKANSAALNTQADLERRYNPRSGEVDGGTPEDTEGSLRARSARESLDTAIRLCQSLASITGRRKNMILFSEGLDIDTTDLIGKDPRPQAGGVTAKQPARYAAEILAAQKALMDAAARANATISTIDPRGLTTGDEAGITAGGLPEGVRAAPPAREMTNETQRGQGTLRTFAEQTGGVAIVNTNNLKGGFTKIVQASSTYYVAGYSPTNTKRDGSFRKINVKLKRSGLDVAARKGYYAPDDRVTVAPPTNGLNPHMQSLLASMLPVSGIPMRVSGGVAGVASGKPMVAITVEMATMDLAFKEQEGQLTNQIAMAYLAVDAGGKIAAANHSIGNLKIAPDQRASISGGLRYVAEFPVAPGQYQLRVAVHETAGDQGASTVLDLDVADPEKAPLSIGAVLVTSASAQAMPTTGELAHFKAALGTPPTAQREFTNANVITALAGIWQGKPAGDVEIVTTVTGPDNREVLKYAVRKTAADLAVASGGYVHTTTIPLGTLQPGGYALTITARSKSGDAASRSLAFSVR